MHSRTRRVARKGFTLVEILIVVVILGILAAIVVPQFANAANDARAGNLASQVKSIQNQIELYRAREGSYPALATLFTELETGGYIKAAPKNPISGGTDAAADVSADWHYDASTGDFGATGYDEELNLVDRGDDNPDDWTDIR